MACLVRLLGHFDVSCGPSCQAWQSGQILHTFLLFDVITLRQMTPPTDNRVALQEGLPSSPHCVSHSQHIYCQMTKSKMIHFMHCHLTKNKAEQKEGGLIWGYFHFLSGSRGRLKQMRTITKQTLMILG